MWYDTERQLRKCPFGQNVLDFAKKYSLPDAKWELRCVHSDLGDDHLYHAEFDIPSRPGSMLSFTFRIDDSQPGPPDMKMISGNFTMGEAPQT